MTKEVIRRSDTFIFVSYYTYAFTFKNLRTNKLITSDSDIDGLYRAEIYQKMGGDDLEEQLNWEYYEFEE